MQCSGERRCVQHSVLCKLGMGAGHEGVPRLGAAHRVLVYESQCIVASAPQPERDSEPPRAGHGWFDSARCRGVHQWRRNGVAHRRCEWRLVGASRRTTGYPRMVGDRKLGLADAGCPEYRKHLRGGWGATLGSEPIRHGQRHRCSCVPRLAERSRGLHRERRQLPGRAQRRPLTRPARLSRIADWAAARRAIGTRKGEQET